MPIIRSRTRECSASSANNRSGGIQSRSASFSRIADRFLPFYSRGLKTQLERWGWTEGRTGRRRKVPTLLLMLPRRSWPRWNVHYSVHGSRLSGNVSLPVNMSESNVSFAEPQTACHFYLTESEGGGIAAFTGREMRGWNAGHEEGM